ncbi:MAG: MBL fold metallo-hydrolase [Microlunatus sp.]|nr:MBL fold metallo-hydrolase [Microlunatus sp.]MDN5771350.1 MBL fold metallo-hydrolase [Microlunatus sp.]MDN5803629.1 MBL fold metallo-hydrolase [Microlunatus sp.]
MFIASFPAGPWQTNCYVVATAPGSECLILDPGVDAATGVRDLVAEHRLKPVAVVLTHGHLDHMFSVAPLCGDYQSTCWIHPDDRHLLTDPLAAMGPEAHLLLAQLTGGKASFAEPDDVRELVDGSVLEIAGVRLDAIHAPGHTAGSVMYRADYPPRELAAGSGIDQVVWSGDVLFAGSIGRTDLPGGDHAQMLTSLRTKVLPLPDTAAVLPGHGPQTTMARERATNPYLAAGQL